MNALKEYEIDNHDELIDAFCETNEDAFFKFKVENEWLHEYWDSNREETIYELEGITEQEAKDKFVSSKAQAYIRFVELFIAGEQ